VSAKADSVLGMSNDHGSFMWSLPDGPARLTGPVLPLAAAPEALSRHEMTTFKSACPTTGLQSASHRFRTETAHLRVPARPKGPFYCRELALLGPSCEAKSLHLDRFAGRRPGRFSAVNCNIEVGISSAAAVATLGSAARSAA
jgi:hypothetical protein